MHFLVFTVWLGYMSLIRIGGQRGEPPISYLVTFKLFETLMYCVPPLTRHSNPRSSMNKTRSLGKSLENGLYLACRSSKVSQKGIFVSEAD